MIQSKSESKITKVITVSGNESVTVLDLPAQKDLLLEMLENLSSETKFEDYVFVRKGYIRRTRFKISFEKTCHSKSAVF